MIEYSGTGQAIREEAPMMFPRPFPAPGRPLKTPTAAVAPIRVLLAGSDAIVAACIEQLFGRERDLEVVGSCSKEDDVLSAVILLKPDILLLEVKHSMAGLELLHQIRPRGKDGAPRIVLVSEKLNEGDFQEVVRTGVRAIVPKDVVPGVLKRCIRRVHAGEMLLGRQVPISRGTQSCGKSASTARAEKLTSREIEIVRLVCGGLRNKQIAKRLGITEGTIKSHLHQVYEKLKVRGRLELGLHCKSKALL